MHGPPDGRAGPPPPRRCPALVGRRFELVGQVVPSSATPPRARRATLVAATVRGTAARSSRAARSSDPRLAFGPDRHGVESQPTGLRVGRAHTDRGRRWRGSSCTGVEVDGHQAGAARVGRRGLPSAMSAQIGASRWAWQFVFALRWRLTTRWSRARVAAT